MQDRAADRISRLSAIRKVYRLVYSAWWPGIVLILLCIKYLVRRGIRAPTGKCATAWAIQGFCPVAFV
jgi:hypothetical protein